VWVGVSLGALNVGRALPVLLLWPILATDCIQSPPADNIRPES
jgi:hypothetical protein